MSFSRLAGIPVDHVVAEVAAFPLASEAALRLAVTEFHPELPGPPDRTQELWRLAEGQILGSFPAFSIEEAVAIRDKIWFGDRSAGVVPLASYLRRLARSFLAVRGGEATAELADDSPGSAPGFRGSPAPQARRAWRWVSFALPPDLLLAAVAPDPSHLPDRLELLSPVVAQFLRDRLYAETHCHIGACLDFSLLWVSALRAVAEEGLKPVAFRSCGACLDEGRDLAPWLLQAALARYVAAAYLARRHWAKGLEAFVAGTVLMRLAQQAPASDASLLLLGLSELGQGTFAPGRPSFASWQALYRRLTHVTLRRFSAPLDQAPAGDPIAGLYPPLRSGRVTPEMRFVAEGLAYLQTFPADRYFARLFWQVLRVRTLFYRHVVQRPMTPGLQWFIRFYGRISPARRPADRLMIESAAAVAGAGQGLRSLEVRTSPPAGHTELWRFLQDLDRVAAGPGGGSLPECGVVLHFTRDRGGRTLQGTPTAAWNWSHADPGTRRGQDPTGNPTGYRYARFYSAKQKEAVTFAWVLRFFPTSLEILRGLDVCTDELGVPNWVLLPLFRHVRRAGEAAAAVLGYHGRNVPVLRTSVHAGEDYVHLLSGLRRVEEALRHFDLREGDRLGHGLALGVEPREWVQRAGRLPMAREERLFDLVWEWGWYGREGLEPQAGRRQMVEREIYRLSEKIFGQPLPPYEVEMLVENLHDVEVLRWARFPNGPVPNDLGPDCPRLQRVRRYLTERHVFQEGRIIEWLDPGAEGEVLASLQAGVRRKVAERGITVEVNPTSNLLIGDLQDLGRHPLWRLRPPRGAVDAPPVSVCIGSDDPITFATHLRQEYQFLHDALLLAGFSDEEARQWLERTRASGLESRFTLPRSDWSLDSLRNAAEAAAARPL